MSDSNCDSGSQSRRVTITPHPLYLAPTSSETRQRVAYSTTVFLILRKNYFSEYRSEK